MSADDININFLRSMTALPGTDLQEVSCSVFNSIEREIRAIRTAAPARITVPVENRYTDLKSFFPF